MSKIYDHNTTRLTEYKESRDWFWCAIFMLCLIWGALEQRYEPDLEQPLKIESHVPTVKDSIQ